MGVLSSLALGDEIGEVNQSLQEPKKENYPVVESLTDPEDAFVDSLLNLDLLGDLMESDSGSGKPVFSSEEVELNVMESAEMNRIAEEGLKVDVSGDVGLGNSKMETGGDVSCGEVMVEKRAAGDGCGELKDLRCLVEEEMGKVNLDGESNVSSAGGIENGDLDIAKQISVKGDEVDGIVQSVGNCNEIFVAGQDGNEAKCQDQESDSDESENDSGSESDDESESSSSSSSSSSSDDDDDDDDEEEEKMGKKGEDGEEEKEKEEGEIAISDNEDGSDGGDTAPTAPIRSKNEIINLPPVAPVNVTLLPHHQTQPVGAVLSILGSQVIIEGIEKHNPLNEGSILWITESRSPLGIVDEVFGQVKSPHYIVRYNAESEVPSGIKPGTLVSFVPEYVDHVLNDKSIYQKGYDASGLYDEELLDEVDFSDDEKEAEYKSRLKIKKRGVTVEKPGKKKKCRKKSQNHPGKWKSDQSATAANRPQRPLRPEIVQSYSGPPFGQTGPNPRFNMPAGGSNVIPAQVPWMPRLHQMPPPPSGLPYQQGQQGYPLLQSGMPFQQRPLPPFQQQIDPFLSGGGQTGVVPPGFRPPATFLNQGMHNHNTPFGMMGTPAQQHTLLPMNLPPPPQIGYNPSFQPDNNSISGNTSMQPPMFHPGRYSGGGRHNNSHGRGGGGGRFSGPGRGRQ